MAISSRSFSTGRCTLFLFSVQAMMLVSSVHSDLSDILFLRRFSKSKTEKDVEGYAQAQNCSNCESEQGAIIFLDLAEFALYNHAQKVVRQHEASNEQLVNRTQENVLNGPQGSTKSSRDENQEEMNEFDPAKLKRQYLRQKRKEKRTAELIHMSRDTELRMRNAAIERTKHFVNKVKDRYSIWRIEYRNPQSDSTLKLMKDQIIMAKIYASIARSKKDFNLYDSLMRHIKESRGIITDANSDNELHTSALERAKAMGRALSMAKDVLLDYNELARKLRAMLQSTEENINSVKKQNTFLVQHAAKPFLNPYTAYLCS
uniref:Galacturonosyltransferase 3 n=1 Tax=Ananas comosus var. bracteatus TaxID=296719 RepID=A0A6V7PIG1_ANACO|nr:unnamed protein product [Ananas comosus var. bracteatus]